MPWSCLWLRPVDSYWQVEDKRKKTKLKVKVLMKSFFSTIMTGPKKKKKTSRAVEPDFSSMKTAAPFMVHWLYTLPACHLGANQWLLSHGTTIHNLTVQLKIPIHYDIIFLGSTWSDRWPASGPHSQLEKHCFTTVWDVAHCHLSPHTILLPCSCSLT